MKSNENHCMNCCHYDMDKYLKKWLNFETKEEKKELLDHNIPYVYGKKLYAATPFWNAKKKYKQHDFITDQENIDFEDLQSLHAGTEEEFQSFLLRKSRKSVISDQCTVRQASDNDTS